MPNTNLDKAARSMMCVGTPPQAIPVQVQVGFQCRTQHDVCWDVGRREDQMETFGFNAARSMMCVGTYKRLVADVRFVFQCRTQHDVCWDSVVPSPCPTRAAKAFWKVIRFSRCFCCQNAFFGRKSAWQIVSIPYPVRVAPFWKVAAEECGLRVPVDHFPFYFDH